MKDYSGKIVGKTEYKVETVDLEGPILTVSLPTEVEQNTTIDLLSYVNATDASGLKGKVMVTPSTLDTSTTGKKQISYRAIDSFNNESVVTVEINVVSKKVDNHVVPTSPPTSSGNVIVPPDNNSSGSTKKTQYRYRTKTVSNYECNFYDCSYADYTDVVAATVSFGSDSYCCTGSGCTKLNPQINYPCPNITDYCIQVMVPLYVSEGNICYSRSYIYSKVDTSGSSTANSSGWHYVEGIQFNRTPKTVCDSNEIKIGEYCHTIDSKGAYVCPNGYLVEGSNCVRLKQQTCSNTCVSESWGSWSDWSYTKVIESDTVQVETR